MTDKEYADGIRALAKKLHDLLQIARGVGLDVTLDWRAYACESFDAKAITVERTITL